MTRYCQESKEEMTMNGKGGKERNEEKGWKREEEKWKKWIK